MRDFDTDTIRVIAAFENITGTEVRDCIRAETIYFLVNPGKIAIAIGREGQTIKTAERMLDRSIKIFEWDENLLQFVKNMIPTANRIEVNGSSITVTLNPKDRGYIIGKGGSNIKIIREFLERNSNIKEVRVI
jgi:NusA-like KH domain protein